MFFSVFWLVFILAFTLYSTWSALPFYARFSLSFRGAHIFKEINLQPFSCFYKSFQFSLKPINLKSILSTLMDICTISVVIFYVWKKIRSISFLPQRLFKFEHRFCTLNFRSKQKCFSRTELEKHYDLLVRLIAYGQLNVFFYYFGQYNTYHTIHSTDTSLKGWSNSKLTMAVVIKTLSLVLLRFFRHSAKSRWVIYLKKTMHINYISIFGNVIFPRLYQSFFHALEDFGQSFAH